MSKTKILEDFRVSPQVQLSVLECRIQVILWESHKYQVTPYDKTNG